jgi:hypothetical protein
MNVRAFLFGDGPDFSALPRSVAFNLPIFLPPRSRFTLPAGPIQAAGRANSGCRRSRFTLLPGSRSGSDRPHRGDILPDLLDQLFAAGKLPHVADAFQ